MAVALAKTEDTSPAVQSMSDLITQILEFKAQETALAKEASAIKAVREELEKEVLDYMKDLGLERSGIGAANVMVQRKRHPQVKNWDEVYEFMLEHNAPYILQKRLLASAIEEFEELGEPVPGIEFYEEDRLVVRRR